MTLKQLIRLLPDSFHEQGGDTISEKTTLWMLDLAKDLNRVSTEPGEIVELMGRIAASAPSVSILHTIYKTREREIEAEWVGKNPKPKKKAKGEEEPSETITEWQERRDAASRDARYTGELLEKLREDLVRKTSVEQTRLNYYRAEIQVS